VDGTIRIYAAKQLSTAITSHKATAQKRPEFANALAAGPDAAVRVALNPGFFRMLAGGISTPRALGLGSMSDPQWKKVKWFRMSIDAPPNLSGSILLQCDDSDSAAALVALLKEKFAAIAADPPKDPVAARVARQLADVMPVAAGSEVTIGFDQKTMEAILVDWFVGVSYRPARATTKVKPAPPATQNAGM
jgi:hypothetical protein